MLKLTVKFQIVRIITVLIRRIFFTVRHQATALCGCLVFRQSLYCVVLEHKFSWKETLSFVAPNQPGCVFKYGESFTVGKPYSPSVYRRRTRCYLKRSGASLVFGNPEVKTSCLVSTCADDVSGPNVGAPK